jgi:hypothetical protein
LFRIWIVIGPVTSLFAAKEKISEGIGLAREHEMMIKLGKSSGLC